MFTAECSPYQDWQAITLVYSYRKAGNSGPITRLLTCSGDALRDYKARPSLAPQPVLGSLAERGASDARAGDFSQ